MALSNGTGFDPPRVWLAEGLSSPILADYDGDARTDLAQFDGASKVFRVALSTGTVFSPFTAWGEARVTGADGVTRECAGLYSASKGSGNFDGNGYADVWCRGPHDGRIFVGRSTGSSFQFTVFADAMCGVGGERIGPADFDGDARDDWYCIDGYGGLFVSLSNGEAFEEGSFQSPGRWDCARDDWTFTDLNGDGKTDATCRPSGAALLSTGGGFVDTGSGGPWCNSWERIPDPEDATKTIEVLRSQMQPMDVDGDRLPELVCTFDGKWVRDVTVRKWDGEKLAPPRVLATQWCRTAVRGGDFDGDGTFELVCDTGAVLRPGTASVLPDLLVEATNGIGGVTTVGYEPSTVFGCNRPPVRQVVTWTATDDGRGGVARTSYAYCGGRTDPKEGTFLGYGEVRTTLPCLEEETACPVTTAVHSQELRSLGRPTLVRRADGTGRVLQETRTFFHPQTGPALPRQALVKEVRTTEFAPSGGATKTTATSYQYDGYGNVTRQIAHGEVGADGTEIPNDERRTETTYWPPEMAGYLVRRPRTEQVSEQRGDGWKLLRSIETVYEGSDLTSVRTSVLPGNGSLLRTMGYDVAGNLVYVRSELGAETKIVPTADGLHPGSVTNPDGTVTTSWHLLCGAPTQVTDPNGTTTVTYDALCRPSRTQGPGEGAFEERFYEGLGDPATQHVRIEGPDGGSGAGHDYRKEYFDSLGRTYRWVRRGPPSTGDIVTERSYNARGRVASETAPFYEGQTPLTTHTTYDPFDRVVSVVPPDGNAVTRSYGLWSETTTDPKQKETTVERGTTFARHRTTIGAEMVTTRTDFDLLGRRRKLTDTRSNVWTWDYDSLGRVLDQMDPDAGRRTFAYDDTARTQSETDALGRTLTLRYDTLGRVVSKTTRDGTASFRYGERHGGTTRNWGRLTTVVSPDPQGPETTLETDYDAAGRVSRQRRTIPSVGWAGEERRVFDAAGRLTHLQYPEGSIAIGPMGYDEAGRLTSIPGILLGVTYDAAGRPLVQRNSNGTETTRSYDPQRGLLDTLATTGPAGRLQSLNYEYDPDLPLVRAVRGSTPAESWTYDYDGGYRLTSAVREASPPDVQTWTYDALDRITANSRLGGYQYPPDGEARPHAPVLVGGAAYGYDAVGNLVAGGGRAPQWDAENRIRAIGEASFTYDTWGERLRKASPLGTSLYPFGDDYEITNGVTTKYVSAEGLGVIAKVVRGGPNPGTFWIHTDRLGSVDAITGSAGAVEYRRTYRPYGDTLEESGTHDESRGWIDQRNDDETQITYLHARYFDPKLGTFLSPDPIGVAGGMNLYGYTSGDPVNRSDRSGLAEDCFTYEVERGSPPPWAGYQSGQGQTSGGGFLGPAVFPASVWKTTIRVCHTTPDSAAHQPGDGSNHQGQGDGYGQEGQGQGGGQNRGGGQNQGKNDGDGGGGDEGGGGGENTPATKTCRTFAAFAARIQSNESLTHSGLFSAVGAPFTAARFIVGGMVSSAMAAESRGLMSAIQAVDYVGRQILSSPLGRTPLTNAMLVGVPAAMEVVPQAALVGVASVGVGLLAFEAGVFVGSVIEATHYVATCN